jgi:DNA-directed RNA polymerase specialized sigma24 family protein
MNEETRDALVLRRLAEGATYEKLAEELGIARDSVRTIAYRARKRAGMVRVWVQPQLPFEPEQ